MYNSVELQPSGHQSDHVDHEAARLPEEVDSQPPGLLHQGLGEERLAEQPREASQLQPHLGHLAGNTAVRRLSH